MIGVIFDLDGVVVSTDELHYAAWKAVADKEGIYFDRDINNLLRGVSRMESLEIILRASAGTYSNEEKTKLADEKNRIYVEMLSNLSAKDILPGINELLATLKKRHTKIAVGSSSRNARSILRQIGLSDMFDAIVDGNDIKNSKPDPEVFLKAIELLGISPLEAYIIEDAKAGIDAAKAAGAKAIAINDAAGYENADFSVTSPMEIAALVSDE